jgi:zinc transport system permease protein
VELLRSRHRAAGDQALALIFYTGIAAGVVLVSAAGALNANLFSFLFGSILTVTWSDFVLVAVLGAVGLAVVAVLYRGLVAVALDEEGARVSGLPIGALNIALAVLAGVTIAVSMRIVGILLIAALMVLPVIAAGRIGTSIRSTIGLAMAIGLVSVVAGLTISYYANLAPGGAIVLLAAGIALVAVGGAPAITRLRSG